MLAPYQGINIPQPHDTLDIQRGSTTIPKFSRAKSYPLAALLDF